MQEDFSHSHPSSSTNMQFVHTHLHTEYSILDGLSKCDEVAKRAKEIGCPAVAITDHGTMAGIVEFYEACQKEGIKPILGLEAYITPFGKSRFERERYDVPELRGKPGHMRNYYHLILLAKDYKGLQSLFKLSDISYSEGYYYKPRIDYDALEKHHEGLICQSACIIGEVSHRLYCDDYEGAKELALWYKNLFGDDYYLEIMNHELSMEKKIMADIRRLGKELDIKVVATNDSHYAMKEDARLQKTQMLLGMHKSWADSDVSGSFFEEDLSQGAQTSTMSDESGEDDPIWDMSSELYIKDYDEMLAAFQYGGGDNGVAEQELANTLEVAEKCNCELPIIDPENIADYKMPVYDFEKDLQYEEFSKSDYEVPQHTIDAIINEMHKLPENEGKTYDEMLNEHERLSVRFLMWMCEKGLQKRIIPKIEQRGEPLPMEFWCENPPAGLKVKHAHNSPDEKWLKEQLASGMTEEDIIQIYRDRLDYEISVIVAKRFTDYFSIVQQYCNYARLMGSQIGAGRGSGAGSLVNCLLGITSTAADPITNNLLFFRFISLSRKGVPDVDCDFIQSFREEKLKPYLMEQYGDDQVSAVATKMVYWGKAAIRAAARALFLPPESIQISDELCEQIEDAPKLNINSQLDGSNPAFEKMANSSRKHRQVVDLALMLQGRISGESIHASAFIVAPEKITDKLPLSVSKDERKRAQDTGEPIQRRLIQTDGTQTQDKLGYVKLDLLALKDLEVLQKTLASVEKHYGCKIDIEAIPLDDEDVFTMVREGLNGGIFQLDGSPVALRMVQDSGADCIGDWSAISALNRPGPLQMGYDKSFINGKIHPENVTYFTEAAKPILEETYGTVCIAEGQLVDTNLGKIPIEQVSVGDKVVDEYGKWHKVSRFFDNGYKDTVRIRSSFGEELICTPDHKIMTQDGWKEAGELTTRDLIKCVNPYKVRNALRTPEDFNWKEWLIGLFIADGHSGKSTPTIACCNEVFARRLANVVKQHIFPEMEGITVERHDTPHSSSTWYVMFYQKHGKNGYFSNDYQENQMNQLLKEYGLFHKTKADKHLPQNYTYSMLIGLFEGDGCFANKRLHIKYEHIAREYYNALLHYGINASIYCDTSQSWTVAVHGDIRKIFPTRILDSRKRIQAAESGKDIYMPRDYIRTLADSDSRVPLKQLHAYQKNECPYISFSSATRIGFVPDKKQHMEWGKVLSVTPHKIEHVYDIEVEDVHQFVCGENIVHNCYQEQVMLLSQEPTIVGFDGGDADTLRKATAKKIPAKVKAICDKAREIAKKNHTDPKITDYFLEVAEASGKYSFNKSHSLAYALVGYRGAFLKCHFPECFLAAMCTIKPLMKKVNKVPAYLEEARQMGVQVKPPHVNYSMEDFDVPEKGVIAFGLGGIKRVGKGAAPIIAEREKNGPFKDFTDFCTRVPKEVGKAPIEALIKAGALDGLGWSRMAMEESIDQIVAFRKDYFREKSKRDLFEDDLFGFGSEDVLDKSSAPDITLVPPFDTEYSELALMRKEREEFGLYFDKDPRDFCQVSRFMLERELRERSDKSRKSGNYDAPMFVNVKEIPDLPDKTHVGFIANVEDFKEFNTKKGKRMASMFVWDNGTGEESRFGFAPVKAKIKCTIFSSVLATIAKPMPDDVVYVTGRVSVDQEGKWPTAVLVDTIELVTPDSQWLGSGASIEKMQEFAQAQADMRAYNEEVANPASKRYMIPAISFKTSDDLRDFCSDLRINKLYLKEGNVQVSAEDDPNGDNTKILHLKQTMGTVKLAAEYGGIAKKIRHPKAARALARKAMLEGKTVDEIEKGTAQMNS